MLGIKSHLERACDSCEDYWHREGELCPCQERGYCPVYKELNEKLPCHKTDVL